MAKAKQQNECQPIARRVGQWAISLGVSERYLYEVIRKGELQSVKLSEKVTIIESQEIERWLESKRVK